MRFGSSPAQSWLSEGYRAFQGWIRGLVPNAGAGELLELFLVSAVCAVLCIRAFLAATGYPQIGGHGLHIAHMLWGGGLMLVALVLLFSFLTQSLARLAAILAGVGFGTFIDELGKFITADHNYFYEPTIGLIYVIFIVIFLALRAVRRTRTLGPADALTNALSQVQESVSSPLHARKKADIQALLDQADPAHPLLPHLRAYVEGVEARDDDRSHFYFRFKEWLTATYAKIAQRRWFAVLLPVLLLVWGVSQAFALGVLSHRLFVEGGDSSLNWTHYAQAVSMSVSVVCVVIGIWAWSSSRARAYRWYIRGALVSIFITQVFVFFHSQLAAVAGLSVNALTYASLELVANLEADAQRHTSAQA